MDIIKICLSSIIGIVLYTLVKQYKPEYALFILLFTAFSVTVTAISILSPYFNTFFAYLNGDAHTALKALAVGIISELIANTASDEGMSSLAFAITLAGRAVILIISLPLLNRLLETAVAIC